MPSILIPLMQFGIPAGVEGIKFLMELLDKLNNNPNMTQDEFNAEWQAMQGRYVAAGANWEAAAGPTS